MAFLFRYGWQRDPEPLAFEIVSWLPDVPRGRTGLVRIGQEAATAGDHEVRVGRCRFVSRAYESAAPVNRVLFVLRLKGVVCQRVSSIRSVSRAREYGYPREGWLPVSLGHSRTGHSAGR